MSDQTLLSNWKKTERSAERNLDQGDDVFASPITARRSKKTQDSAESGIKNQVSRINNDLPSNSGAVEKNKDKFSLKNLPNWWRGVSPKKRRWFKAVGITGGVLLVGITVLFLAAFTVYAQARNVQGDIQQVATEGRLAYDSFKRQNLPETDLHLSRAKEQLVKSQTSFQKMGYLKFIPVVRGYYFDGEAGLQAGLAGLEAGQLALEAIKPHADLLGFSGEGTFEGGTTEDRIGLMLETLAQITPQLDSISAKVEEMNDYAKQIDPQKYPENIAGHPVRSYVKALHDGAQAAATILTDARPAIEQLPAIAGAGERQKYLVIFQNDNELRPTGGFMTAYAVVFVEDGKVTPEKSDDIYELDKKFSNKPPIPETLGKYLTTERYWNLRDMNIDPNFANSMADFYENYQQIRGEPKDIDGIIAVDTVLLANVVEVLGPVEVPGYGTFSAEPDPQCGGCPQIIYALSEIIDRPTPYIREDRKGILAPMMQAIIQKTYATSRDKWPLLAQLVWQSIEGRHTQMYFFDEDKQLAAQSINAAGIIPKLSQEGDYLTIIDANLGGAKSNLFTEVSGSQTVQEIANGRLRKEVELTYRNTHAASNCNLEAGLLCLNATLNNWTRWYVPKGTQVEQLVGFENEPVIDTSNQDYDVIEGFFKLNPMSQAKIRATLSVPYNLDNKEYVLSMQKQGGTDPIPFEIATPFGQTEFTLDKDITIRVP